MNYSSRIYEEECVYSVRARLLRDFLYFHSKGLSFLGKIRTLSIDTELPCNLQQFQNLAAKFLPWTVDSMINDHTVFNFYKAFLSFAKHDNILALMARAGSDIHLSVGIKSSSVLSHSKFPLYCPECSRLDIIKYGEPFYRRIHQLSNIQICPDHNCLLVVFRPQIKDMNGVESFPLDEHVVKKSTFTLNVCNIAFRIARECQQILTDKPFNFKELMYEELFRSKGYFHKGKLLRSEIVGRFQSYYGDVKNEYLKSRITDSYHWIGQLVLNPEKVFNPFHHMLFKTFVDELPSKILPVHPFGSGPFPCFNKICRDYLKDFIPYVEIEFTRAGKLIGVFTCLTCSMVYIRQPNAVASKKLQIRERGTLWMNELKTGFSAGCSNQEMSKRLGTNSSVINMYRKKFNISSEIKRKRLRWSKLIKKFGYTQARVEEPKLYSWLFRYDREWLLSSRSQNVAQNPSQLRIDWNKLDDTLCEEIAMALTDIQNSNRRISRELISRLVPNGNYIHSTTLKNLPRAKNLITVNIETTEQFQLKKIERSFKSLIIKNQSVSKWNILKGAGISKPSKKILVIIEKLCRQNYESKF